MNFYFSAIPFKDFLDGTIQIAIFFLILTIIIVVVFLTNLVDKVIHKMNTKLVTKDSPQFKTIYISLVVAIILSAITITFISVRDLLPDTTFFFYIFGSLSFFFLPLALGIFPAVIYALHRKKFRWGNITLLLLFFCIMSFMGSNIHDIIWCYDVTDGLQIENLAGRDLVIFFRFFGIPDRTQWDYRTFFSYMVVLVLIELITATLVYIKFAKIQKQDKETFNTVPSILVFLMLLVVGIANGAIIFVIDQPFNFSQLFIRLMAILGIPIIILLLILTGFLLSEFVTQNVVLAGENTSSQE